MSLPREFVDILAPSQKRDGDGQSFDSWEVLHRSVPASVWFASGTESPRGQQVEAVGTHKVKFRWIAGIDSTMRIRHGETTYEIVSCGDPEGRRHWMICTVTVAS